MKVTGLITEYNPFHFGHLYHLQKSKEISNSTHTVAVMSGSFVQRGEPSIIDKWTKASIAVDNGVDLVIELPFVFSVQSAEYFSRGAIKILNSLNIIESLVFGSESGNLEELSYIANIFNEEPLEFKKHLKKYLEMGYSFSSARSEALNNYLETNNNDLSYSNILKQSNNILGIEYLKALKKLNSDIVPLTFKRLGNNYNDNIISTNYPSATALRNRIINDGFFSIKDMVPENTYKNLDSFYEKYSKFNTLENYNSIFKYLLRIKSPYELKKILDVGEGLENRLKQLGSKYNDMKHLIEIISTKRYPKTRIQRILTHLLLDLNGDMINKIYKNDVEYIRVLGSNEKGFELIKKIKEKSDIHIITKYSKHEKIKNEYMSDVLRLEEKATDIYFLGLDNQTINMDYLKSPYIK